MFVSSWCLVVCRMPSSVVRRAPFDSLENENIQRPCILSMEIAFLQPSAWRMAERIRRTYNIDALIDIALPECMIYAGSWRHSLSLSSCNATRPSWIYWSWPRSAGDNTNRPKINGGMINRRNRLRATAQHGHKKQLKVSGFRDWFVVHFTVGGREKGLLSGFLWPSFLSLYNRCYVHWYFWLSHRSKRLVPPYLWLFGIWLLLRFGLSISMSLSLFHPAADIICSTQTFSRTHCLPRIAAIIPHAIFIASHRNQGG